MRSPTSRGKEVRFASIGQKADCLQSANYPVLEFVKIGVEDAAAPMARLIGHSLAAAVGFCALAGISLIPIEVLKLLSLAGMPELVRPLQVLEQTLLFADVCLFAVILLSGIAVFAAETVRAAHRRIRQIASESDRES